MARRLLLVTLSLCALAPCAAWAPRASPRSRAVPGRAGFLETAGVGAGLAGAGGAAWWLLSAPDRERRARARLSLIHI